MSPTGYHKGIQGVASVFLRFRSWSTPRSKGILMHIFFMVVFLIGTTQLTYAFDLGDIFKQPKKTEETTTGSGKEVSPAEKTEKKQPSLTDLTELAMGTSTEEEIAIGEEIAGRLLGAAPLVQDEGLQRYVNEVGNWVALQSNRAELNWYFGVLDSEDINAFAAPGGFIFLTKGLYRKLHNEAELAGVLGHEIGHVVKRHHLNLIQKSKAIDMGSSLLSQKFGKNKKSGEAIQNLIGNGAEIMARELDKDAEYEADRIGVVVATRAGYDAYGLPTVLQEIGHVGSSDSSVALLFKTHPHPDTRLTELGNSMGEKFDKYPEGKSVTDRFYILAK